MGQARMTQHDARIIQELRGRINGPVDYRVPKGKGEIHGRLEDRVVVRGNPGPGQKVRYYDVVDRIRFEGDRKAWIRVGYFTELPNGTLRWGSKTAFTAPESEWEALFRMAMGAQWFRDFFQRLRGGPRQEDNP